MCLTMKFDIAYENKVNKDNQTYSQRKDAHKGLSYIVAGKSDKQLIA